MKISTQAIKFINQHYGSAGDPAPNGIDDLVQKIGAQLGAVEEVVDFGKRFKDVVIVKVISCEDHPNADRLHVCKVDDGGKVPDVERDAQGLVQVVCGAPNVRAGILAAWLPPSSTVPNTVDNDPFVLSARDIRGVVSNGMMASPKELSLGDGHEGILEITEDFGPIAPGTMFADAYHLQDDHIIDMENKMFTHRPDCFGYLGIARELEGIQHRPYKSPAWYQMKPGFPNNEAEELPFEVKNEIPQLVPRFTAVALRDVKVGPSPVWLQVDLARAGIRSINNIVDYTNFFMLETGQPIHAYDYDKVRTFCGGDIATLTVRFPRSGEKIVMLNGKEIEPRPETMMVAAGDHLACVGGAIGGADTEVDEHTKNIILEAASWDMYAIRRTAMAHGIFTDAVTRFSKGQSPLQNLAVLAKVTDEVRKFAGGKVASALVDINQVSREAIERGNMHPPVTVTAQFINERLGWELSAEQMTTLLTNVEFKVVVNGDELTVTAPFWRTDIEIPEDIVEEIGRLNGYDKLPLVLPQRDLTPAPKDPLFEFKGKVRTILSRAGANEVLTYNFIHGNLLDKMGQDKTMAFRLSNALSPDLQYLRTSLTPSLLEKVHPNIKAGHAEFVLFEINKVHAKDMLDDENLPREFNRITLTLAADEKAAASDYAGAPYYQAKKYLELLLSGFGVTDSVQWMPLAKADFGGHALIEQMAKPYEPNRSAVLVKDGLVVGVVGEYRRAVQKALKLPAFAAGFEVFHSFIQMGSSGQAYTQLPRFPKIEQDICLKVPTGISYGQLYQFVEVYLQQNRPDKTHHLLSPMDIYQREDSTNYKQITLRLSLSSYERTLTDAEVSTLLDAVAKAASQQFQAERL